MECRTFLEWFPGASSEAPRSWFWASNLVSFRIQLRLQLASAHAILTLLEDFLESVVLNAPGFSFSFRCLMGLRCMGHLMLTCAGCTGGFWIVLYAHKVLHVYLYGTRSLPCFPKHFERMCAVCVDIGSNGSNIDCRRKRVAALSVPFENI